MRASCQGWTMILAFKISINFTRLHLCIITYVVISHDYQTSKLINKSNDGEDNILESVVRYKCEHLIKADTGIKHMSYSLCPPQSSAAVLIINIYSLCTLHNTLTWFSDIITHLLTFNSQHDSKTGQ